MPNIKNRDKKLYIMLHLLLGVLLFYFPYLSSYIGLLVIAYSTYLILFHNKSNSHINFSTKNLSKNIIVKIDEDQISMTVSNLIQNSIEDWLTMKF